MPTQIRIPNLNQANPIVDKDGRMTNEFARRLNDILSQIVTLLNQIAILPAIQEALATAQQAAQDAIDAADAANAAAGAAQQQTDTTKREAAIQGSYIDPDSVLLADPSVITIGSHTRFYADGTSAPVSGGTVPSGPSGETDYVFYVDPERDGGTVVYQVTTVPPVQTGDTHVVGAVLIPETGTVDGGEGPRRPGYVQAKLATQNDE